MNFLFKVLIAVLVLPDLSSCATWMKASPHPGQTEAEVIARLDQSTHVYPDGSSKLLEYMHGPM